MTMTKTDPREITLDILLEVLEEGRLGHLVLNQALLKYQYLEKQDRSFITKLTEGTLERLILLDAALDRFSKTKTEKMKPMIRTILRMSAYQILFMDRVPDAAVCNEAVKLAKKRKFQGLSGFVWQLYRSNGAASGCRNFYPSSGLPGYFGYILYIAQKKEATNRCLDETNCFPYSFRPFLDYFPEHLDKHHYGNTCCP